MPTLREKMKQEMLLIGLAESTQQRYIESVAKLQDHYKKSPAKLSIEEIKNYLLHLKKRIYLQTVITLSFML
jgi:hypothetical protein